MGKEISRGRKWNYWSSVTDMNRIYLLWKVWSVIKVLITYKIHLVFSKPFNSLCSIGIFEHKDFSVVSFRLTLSNNYFLRLSNWVRQCVRKGASSSIRFWEGSSQKEFTNKIWFWKCYVTRRILFFFSDSQCQKLNMSVFMWEFPRGFKCEIIPWEVMRDEMNKWIQSGKLKLKCNTDCNSLIILQIRNTILA